MAQREAEKTPSVSFSQIGITQCQYFHILYCFSKPFADQENLQGDLPSCTAVYVC